MKRLKNYRINLGKKKKRKENKKTGNITIQKTSFVLVVVVLHIVPLVFLDLEFRDEQQQADDSDELDDHLKDDQLEEYLGKGEGVQLERERPREIDGGKGELHRLGYTVWRPVSWNEKSRRAEEYSIHSVRNNRYIPRASPCCG